jgi:hypothetical protein
MDLESYTRWYDYSVARDRMLEATDMEVSPWHVARTDDKRRGRLNIISHLLSLIPYKPVEHEKVTLPKRSEKRAYDDSVSMEKRRYVTEKF